MPLVIRADSVATLKTATVWRYFQADAVFYTFLNSTLRFTQVREFQDHWEGLISPASRRQQIVTEEGISRDSGFPLPPQAFGHLENFNKIMNYVSSWSLITPDKMLMWQAYTQGLQGVAIEADMNQIQEQLTPNVDSGEIGLVTYVDLEVVPAPSLHWREELFRKRLAFEHEQEVRIVVDNMFNRKSGPFQYSDFPKYHYELINLSCIKSIQVHPYSSDELISSLVKLMDQLELDIPVTRSVIADNPKI